MPDGLAEPLFLHTEVPRSARLGRSACLVVVLLLIGLGYLVPWRGASDGQPLAIEEPVITASARLPPPQLSLSLQGRIAPHTWGARPQQSNARSAAVVATSALPRDLPQAANKNMPHQMSAAQFNTGLRTQCLAPPRPVSTRAEAASGVVAERPQQIDGVKLDLQTFAPTTDEITEQNPLRVIIAGAGIGGLALADSLVHDPKMHVTVLERTDEFKRFGGPIQLASNALQVMKTMDKKVYDEIMEKFTFTGDKVNGIKDGIRNEWYLTFDLQSPADSRDLPYTGVIERPDLQEIYLKALPHGIVRNGDGVDRIETNPDGHGVKAVMQSGAVHEGDVIIGADGIWSQVRASMRSEPAKGEGSGVTYSGYTVFAGELTYASHDNGEVGYKVYIGPGQYFVITDIGNGRYQWYAFLAREPGSVETEAKPDGQVPFLREIFKGWSHEIHHILNATGEDEIGQRDLYDLPPSVRKPWTAGPVALLGDAVHAMMPNLGQGGGQAIEDAFVIQQELKSASKRSEIAGKFESYRSRRLVRSAAVQGLSRMASDLVINTFDTPFKVYFDGGLKVENFSYLSVLTRLWQPILPLFFKVQFDFLYDGWKNEAALDLKAGIGILLIGGVILLGVGGFDVGAVAGLELGLESLFGSEGLEAILANVKDFF